MKEAKNPPAPEGLLPKVTRVPPTPRVKPPRVLGERSEVSLEEYRRAFARLEERVNYPEHEKLKDIQEQSQWLGEILEWMREQRAEPLLLCTSVWGMHGELECLKRVEVPVQTLLAEFFEIDLVKIEKEKQAMLEEARQRGIEARDPDLPDDASAHAMDR